MKNLIAAILISVFSVPLMPDCASSQPAPRGSIEFTFPPPPNEEVVLIEITLTRPEGNSHQASVPARMDSSVVVRFAEIEAGQWDAFIRAAGSDGKILYSAEKTIELRPGEEHAEDVWLEPLREGKTNVVASWAETGTYLSDLTPNRYENIMGGVGRDATYWGNPLVVNGASYSKGIVTHPDEEPGFVEYILDGRYSRFRARAAILDDAREGGESDGNATFSVEVDGTVIYSEELDCHGKQWDDIDLDIRGARVLRLLIDNANGKTWSDHAAWLDARVM